MLEIEIKARAGNLEDVRKKVEDIGAKFVSRQNEIDSYYNIVTRDFASTDEALRIRQADRCTLTYKGPKVDNVSKTREEVNVHFDDADALKKIFLRLGFSLIAEVRKERRMYELGEYELMLDDVANVGKFVEVEVQGTEKELESKRKGAFDVMHRLGLDQFERRSYLELLLETRGKGGKK